MKSVFIFITGILISACAHISDVQESQSLEARINQLAAARLTQDWEQVYDLADEEYKEKMSKIDFTNIKRSMNYVSYSIEDIQKEGLDKAHALVVWDFEAGSYLFKGHKEQQTWVYQNGAWNLLMPKSTKFGFDE